MSLTGVTARGNVAQANRATNVAPNPASDPVTPAAVPKGPVTPAAPSLREQITLAEGMTGKKSSFANETALKAYLSSLERAQPQGVYDPNGFLAGLGVNGVRASGRTDTPVLDAVRAQPGYIPNDNEGDGKQIWIQGKFFDLAMKNPKAFAAAARVANPVMEAKGKAQAKWKKPFESVQTPVPTHEAPEAHYPQALGQTRGKRTLTFGPDVHGGIPNANDPHRPTYGTYSIARSLGFNDATARRLGSTDVGVDGNVTPYGKTSPMPTDQIDRHFNLDRGAEDTRLVYARDHLTAAIKLAKATSYDQAEIELGLGLHSLQDLFAHGQISPSVHAVLGQFPDEVNWNPVAFYEATGATAAYLEAYLKAIATP